MRLTVVGLPIGNIEDISFRAIKTLQEASFIVCEDTRMFRNLWTKLVQLGYAKEMKASLRFVNDFNEERVLPRLLNEMSTIQDAVLVSDAGMPLISDPGYKLVKAGVDMGWDISVVPGPTAESAALSISGLPTDKYMFVGFLPKKPGKRHELLTEMSRVAQEIKCSLVVYESAARINKLLPEIEEIYGGETEMFVGIDLTKVSQKVYRGSISFIKDSFQDKKIKGEICIVIGRKLKG